MEDKTYSHDEAYQASLDYFKGDELAARVWVNKYALLPSPVERGWGRGLIYILLKIKK